MDGGCLPKGGRGSSARVTRIAHPRLLALAFALVTTWPAVASADTSSWLFVGTGPSWTKFGSQSTEQKLSLKLDTGVGTPPGGDVIVGGLFNWQTHFGLGTDVGVSVRTATHGFVNGDWGAAIDLGGYQRWWGQQSTGVQGSLVLGAPWGVTLVATAGRGTHEAQSYSGVIGIDLARLTVYRRSGESWWKNTFPAYRPEDERH